MQYSEMIAKVAGGAGFIAALDQSGGSTPKALKGYGIAEDAWDSEEAMFALIHDMRARIIRSPAFHGGRVIGAILFERTMDGMIDGQPTPAVLIKKGVVPFLKIDKGLEEEGFGGFGGVQMMKPIAGLEQLLARSKALGIFGTKQRSVIHSADRAGISAIVQQQFDVGGQVLDAGMIPILEPEVNIKSETRADCDDILLEILLAALDRLPAHQQVMLKLSLPAVPGKFSPLVGHPKVLRLVALSGGYNRPDACASLAKNTGIIASFSRALLEDLRAQMSDEEFDAALDTAIAQIFVASNI